MTDVLLVGLPRSGTTWASLVLSATDAVGYLEEPDNHFRSAYAYGAKRRLGSGEYPALVTGESGGAYGALWDAAFAGAPATRLGSHRLRHRLARRLLDDAGVPTISAVIARRSTPSPRLRLAELLAVPERPDTPAPHLLVKSVHAQLSLEWLATRRPVKVVVVLREPLNAISSWHELGWLDRTKDDMLDELDPRVRRELSARLAIPAEPRAGSPYERAAWLFGALTYAMLEAARRHPEWQVVSHEDLSASPHEGFPELARRLELPWEERGHRLLDELNRPGSGYEPKRVSSGLVDIWRGRLGAAEADAVSLVLATFPVADWSRRLP